MTRIEVKNKQEYRLTNDDLMKLVMNFRDLTVTDLGRWLMTKTDDSFTVVEFEFIKQACSTIEDIAKSVDLFKKVIYACSFYQVYRVPSNELLQASINWKGKASLHFAYKTITKIIGDESTYKVISNKHEDYG